MDSKEVGRSLGSFFESMLSIEMSSERSDSLFLQLDPLIPLGGPALVVHLKLRHAIEKDSIDDVGRIPLLLGVEGVDEVSDGDTREPGLVTLLS
jgi:hypothetical protein